MSQRVIVSSLVGIAALGAVAAGGYAVAFTGSKPTALKNGSAHYTAPSGGKAGSFTFTTDVTGGSGIRGLKVLVRPRVPS